MNQAKDHKTRYALLFDRRRALHELSRLASRIATHPNWHQAANQGNEAERLLRHTLETVMAPLCDRPNQAGNDVLLQDVRCIYRGLAALSRLWVNLETAQSLTPTLPNDLEA